MMKNSRTATQILKFLRMEKKLMLNLKFKKKKL